MGTTTHLFLTRDVTAMDKDTTLLRPTEAILADMKAMVALLSMEGNILPTRKGMVDMEHQGDINTAVSIDKSTPSVVTTLQVLPGAITNTGVNPIIQVLMEETIANVAARTTTEVMASMEEIIRAVTESLEHIV